MESPDFIWTGAGDGRGKRIKRDSIRWELEPMLRLCTFMIRQEQLSMAPVDSRGGKNALLGGSASDMGDHWGRILLWLRAFMDQSKKFQSPRLVGKFDRQGMNF